MLGRISKLWAKMSGIIPAVLTRSGTIGALAAHHHHAVAADRAHTLTVLHRDTALAFLDPHDHADHDQRHEQECNQHCRGLRQHIELVRNIGDDAGKDDQRNTVTDTLFGDELPRHTPIIVPAVMPMIIVSVGSRSPPVKPQLGRTGAAARACQQRALGNRLEHSQRNGQPQRVLIDLWRGQTRLPCSALPVQG